MYYTVLVRAIEIQRVRGGVLINRCGEVGCRRPLPNPVKPEPIEAVYLTRRRAEHAEEDAEKAKVKT